MDQDLIDALQDQFNKERQNAQFYFELASEADNANWPGTAKFFKASAYEELQHSDWFGGFLIARNVLPRYDAIPQIPSVAGDSLVAWFEAALAKEKETTAAISALHEMADDDVSDPQTIAFLKEPLDEQTKSELEITDILKELRRSGPDGWIVLDQKYGEMKDGNEN